MLSLFIWKSNLFFNANLKYSLQQNCPFLWHDGTAISYRENDDLFFTNDLKSCFLSAAMKYDIVDSGIVFRRHDVVCVCNLT